MHEPPTPRGGAPYCNQADMAGDTSGHDVDRSFNATGTRFGKNLNLQVGNGFGGGKLVAVNRISWIALRLRAP
jgi:hypothetical protein